MGKTLCLLVALCAVAHADDSKALFEEGRELAKQGKYPEACDRFERSEQLAPANGTEINLADCYEHVGKLREAYDLFDKVATEALRDNQIPRAKMARARADAIAPRLPKQEPAVVQPQPPPQDMQPPPQNMQPPPQDMQPPPGSSHATFVSTGSVAWNVTIGDAQACTTPCSLWVPPAQFVAMHSDERDPVRLDVGMLPAGNVMVAAEPEQHGKYAAGVTFAALSGTSLVTGLTLGAVGFGTDSSGMETAGVICTVVGALGLYGSIELMRAAVPKLHVGPAQPYAGPNQVGIAGRF